MLDARLKVTDIGTNLHLGCGPQDLYSLPDMDAALRKWPKGHPDPNTKVYGNED
jgi:hypothetical protein